MAVQICKSKSVSINVPIAAPNDLNSISSLGADVILNDQPLPQSPSRQKHSGSALLNYVSAIAVPQSPTGSSPTSNGTALFSLVLIELPFRTVTTDATASHTDRNKIPESGDEHFTINLSPEAFETYNIDPLSLEMDVTKNELTKMYQDMVVIRRMELASDALYKAKKIRGLYHQLKSVLMVVGMCLNED
jgi:hypothetical protein